MIVEMIYVKNLLFSSLFLSSYATGKHRQAVITLKIHNPSLDRFGATHFLTLRDPCLGFDPKFAFFLLQHVVFQNISFPNSASAETSFLSGDLYR